MEAYIGKSFASIPGQRPKTPHPRETASTESLENTKEVHTQPQRGDHAIRMSRYRKSERHKRSQTPPKKKILTIRGLSDETKREKIGEKRV